MNLMCKRILKMPFIGEFSLQNVRSNFQCQTKKKSFDVSLIAGNFAIKLKRGIFILEIRISHPYSGFEISKYSLWDSRQHRRKWCQNVLTINDWQTPKSIECLLPLLQLKHLLNQYIKRHYDLCKGCASLAIHYFLCIKPPDSEKKIPLEHLLGNSVDG